MERLYRRVRCECQKCDSKFWVYDVIVDSEDMYEEIFCKKCGKINNVIILDD